MLVVSRFAVPEGGAAQFEAGARALLEALSARPGFLRGRLGRAVDEDQPGTATWAVVTEWDTVGSYRRALSPYDVKVAVAAVAVLGVPEAGAFEVVAAVDEPSAPLWPPSGRARAT